MASKEQSWGRGGRGGRECCKRKPAPGALAEHLVLMELSGIVNSDFFLKCENKCKILGMDTERFTLQVESYAFSGE